MNEEVDPISGNEVPPGAMPEEVRDDVDAKLSEGEYVIPADVLRFYGVKFFEDLRSKAKQKLAEMDADGRMGEPSEEEFPFSEEELLFEEEEEVPQEAPVKMAEGGLVNPADTSGRFETKEFVGPDGKTIKVLFVGGEALTEIPRGYTEKTIPTEALKQPEVPKNPTGTGRDERDVTTETRYDKPTSEWSNEEILKVSGGFDEQALVGRGLSMAMGPVSGLARKVMDKAMQQRQASMLEEVDKRVSAGQMSQEEAEVVRSNFTKSKSEDIMGSSVNPMDALTEKVTDVFSSRKQQEKSLEEDEEKEDTQGAGQDDKGPKVGSDLSTPSVDEEEDVAQSFAKGGLVKRPRKSRKKKC